MKIVTLGSLTMIFITATMSQLQIKLSISRIDSVGHVDTAYFGVDERATYCIDTSLGEREIWWQACGLVPCLAFVDVRTGSGACLGTGTTIDLRPYYSSTQVDTYKLLFDGYPPMVFHWQPNIAAYYGAMTFMNNRDTNVATVKINMLAQDSFVITPQLLDFRWYIRAESPNSVTDVHYQDRHRPPEPALSQNYPNPFNPVTTIDFTLEREAMVTITVYDLLGRKVRILAKDQPFSQGAHTLNFAANGLPSGVYFYRLVATRVKTGLLDYAAVKKMILCR